MTNLKLQFFFQESEELEYRNQHLKSEIQNLELEKRRLIEVLSSADPTLAKRLKSMSASTTTTMMTSSASTSVSSSSAMRVHVDNQFFQEPLRFPDHSDPPSFSDAAIPARTDHLEAQNIHNIKVEAEDEFSRSAANFRHDGSSAY